MRTIVMPSATGNELLTCAAAVVLTVLPVAEGITIVRMGGLVTVHMFVGMVLIPPVLLKLAAPATASPATTRVRAPTAPRVRRCCRSACWGRCSS